MSRPQAWLAVGRIRRPHGIHGEITVEVLTDFPQRLTAGMEIGIGEEAPDQRITVEGVRLHKGDWLLRLDAIHSRDQIEPWRGRYVFLPAQPRDELPANYFYEHELAGCRCVLTDGSELGEVTALLPGVGAALLAVAASGREVLVPFRSPIVIRVDLAAKTVVLDPPRGLFDDDAL